MIPQAEYIRRELLELFQAEDSADDALADLELEEDTPEKGVKNRIGDHLLLYIRREIATRLKWMRENDYKEDA